MSDTKSSLMINLISTEGYVLKRESYGWLADLDKLFLRGNKAYKLSIWYLSELTNSACDLSKDLGVTGSPSGTYLTSFQEPYV